MRQIPSSLVTRQYFASVEPDKLTKECAYRVISYDDYVKASGRLTMWARSYEYYNRGVFKDGRLNRVGEQAEYTEIYVNHFRNLLTHILNMTTSQRPSFDCRATNTDSKSQQGTILGNNIVDYYNRSKCLEKFTKAAVEDILQFGDSYIYQGWDFSLGDPYAPDPNTPNRVVKQGDIFHKNFTQQDVIFDYVAGLRGAEPQWYIIRDFQNKWDLVQRYPELREKILNASADEKLWAMRRIGPRNGGDIADDIPVFIFIHDRTPAMPGGRFFTYISDDCWFIDSPLPEFYKILPLHRLTASKDRQSGFGYSIAFDLLPIQEAIDGLYSTILTNQSTFGVQNILMPKGCDINVTELADGLNQISYDPKLGAPKALDLVSTKAEIFQFLAKLEAVMETISGVNSVARGNPESSLKSGSALALVQSMAIQFISGLQESYAILLENIATSMINILQKTATTPRMVEIAGISKRSSIRAFTQEDISNINRVVVDIGNPISRTTAGRVSMADNLLQAKMIENPEQYIQVMSTGKLEPMIEGRQAELMLIRDENERMANGEEILAVVSDDHPTHVLEHRVVLASVDARNDSKIVEVVTKHMQDHILQWKGADPALLEMLKMALPPAPLTLPGVGPAGGVPPQKAPGVGGPMVPGDPTMAAAAKTRLPNLPKNPISVMPNGG